MTHPGDYKIFVQVKYWTHLECDQQPRTTPGYCWDTSLAGIPLCCYPPPLSYRIASQTNIEKVSAPQFAILSGAVVGGIIAFIVVPQTGTGWRQRFWSLLGACLLAVIVTILLSRLSETQFLIRVTVSDFWGAIAIGFVANVAGAKVLEIVIPQAHRKDDKGQRGSDGHNLAAVPHKDKDEEKLRSDKESNDKQKPEAVKRADDVGG